MIVVTSGQPPGWLGAGAVTTQSCPQEHSLALLMWLPWPPSVTASASVGSPPPTRTDPQSSLSHSLSSKARGGFTTPPSSGMLVAQQPSEHVL